MADGRNDFPDTTGLEAGGLRRSLTVVVAVASLVGVLLVLLVLVRPSVGAAGGCGGG